MRIAIFSETYFPYISGVNTHIKTLKEGLEAQGHKVLIVTSNPKNPKYDENSDIFFCPGIEMKKIYGYGISNPINPSHLNIIKRFNPDVIHIHTEFSIGMMGQLSAILLRKPIVYTLHTMYDDYIFYIAPKRFEKPARLFAHKYFKTFAEKSSEIIGPSEKVVEFLNRCGVKRKINIVRNTVDLTEFLEENIDKTKVEQIKNDLGIRPNDVALCFIGRLGKEKSIDVLIDYFTKYFRGNEKFKLFIIGGGAEYDILEEQIETNDMAKQIKLLGKIDHNILPNYYHAFDLYTTASLSEINSISMLEAMASGLYVVHRLDKFTKNQISIGENGNLFETPEEMAELILEEFKLTPEQREERRKKVTASVLKYGREEFIDCILEVYNKALTKHKK